MIFSKMHGLGNDFMVVDGVTQNTHFSSEQIKFWSDRHRGVGFDQLLLIEPPYSPDVDFHYRIFNANGQETSQCGNGARCIAHFIRLKGLSKKKEITVSTHKGIMTLCINEDSSITVNMGKPQFEPKVIPFKAQKQEKTYLLRVNEHTVFCSAVSMGNPHCVIQVDSIANTTIPILGPLIEKHERFPEGVNVGFMEIVSPKYIRLRVHERGVGETHACGSGACAAVAIGIKQQLLTNEVTVELPGGHLHIVWDGNNDLMMTGPATHVYDGFMRL